MRGPGIKQLISDFVAIQFDWACGKSYVGRSIAYLHAKRDKEAGEDLVTALSYNASIQVNIALEFVKWSNDEASVERAVFESQKRHTGEYEQAGALENLGLYYIRTAQWQKAFDHTAGAEAEP